MYSVSSLRKAVTVALLAEGVDRNSMTCICWDVSATVALLTEGVDRNIKRVRAQTLGRSRLPHGGRG